MRHFNLLSFAVVAALSVASAQAAGPRNATTTGAAAADRSVSTSLAPAARGQAIHAFVSRWGAYVENTYGTDVHEWAQRMVGQFAMGDAANIQRALQRNTFEGAMAELDGVGHRLSDARAINLLASASSSDPTPTALGDIDKDLVYTPVPPCRIVDTRVAGAGGPIPAMTSRGFLTWGLTSYAGSGGSASDCGMQDQHPTTVVFNVTAVRPAGAGYATVYSGALASPPFAASINYTAGATVNNSVLTDINPGTAIDFKIYTFATSNYVVDLVGFYDNPYATALDCVTLPGEEITIGPNSVAGATSPLCATGFTQTSLNCDSSSSATILTGQRAESFSEPRCRFKNTGSSDVIVIASTRCCRVPGR